MDGGCEDPEKCNKLAKERDAYEAAQVAQEEKLDQELQDYFNIPKTPEYGFENPAAGKDWT